ncbi:hypothetical protein [Curtobacterium oceanosedimentum]|uniref:hypothetical protein n=1 Tax=Curtobacterium oceanosedimentum TaxID=465820 RepID=UPI003390A8F1
MKPEPCPSLPGLEELEPYLEPLQGTRAWVVPMTGRSGKLLGNNGDALMHAVFLRILASFSIETVDDQRDAQVVVVPPSGALLESYAFPDLLAERIRGSEGLPLIVFPSSALFPTRDPSFMFEDRTAPTTWMLRELPSMTHLSEQWGTQLSGVGVQLVLLHDVVALGHSFVSEIVGPRVRSPKTLLIAPRADRERTSAIGTSAPRVGASSRMDELVHLARSSGVGRRVIRFVRRRRTAALAERLAGQIDTSAWSVVRRRTRRTVRLDLSSTQFCSFDEYARTLRAAEVVITDRLHVALPAAILGAEVYVAEAGYHKLRGVYENSLRGMTNVTLVG